MAAWRRPFHEGWDLPCGEAFILLDSDPGRDALRAYFDRYVPMALAARAGFVLESPTWRANSDWAEKVGYGRDALARVNRAAIDLMAEVRARYETPQGSMVISGCIGPRGDDYDPGELMSPSEAEAYHAFQIGVFRDAGADFVSAFTMTNSNEVRDVAQAAKGRRHACVISFTLETGGTLPREGRLNGGQGTGLAVRPSPPTYFASSFKQDVQEGFGIGNATGADRLGQLAAKRAF
jgi:homocysteine S-methyltransferase